jgi:hypothetical protein
MKRACSILFLWIYLVANTELHQFLRLPVFFVHYQEHRAESPDISLLEFITLHYYGPDANITYGHDSQLPFKDKCPEVSLSIALPPEDIAGPTPTLFTTDRKEVMFKSLFVASSFQFAIWQPPRA